MTASSNEGSSDFSDIDLAWAVEYMRAHNVGRLDLSIERADVSAADLLPPSSVLLMLRDTSLSEEEPPSSDGLSGVFAVLPVSEHTGE